MKDLDREELEGLCTMWLSWRKRGTERKEGSRKGRVMNEKGRKRRWRKKEKRWR